jgi:subtilase family serine protease
MRTRRRRKLRPVWDTLDDRCLPSAYTPAQIITAYGLSGITFTTSAGTNVAGDGSGQTIAIVDVYTDPNLQASLNAFDAQYGLPSITLNVINQAGSQTDTGWAEEETIDVEWAHVMAPGAAIDVIEAAPGNSDSEAFADILAAVQTASTSQLVTVVSMSWGSGEANGEASFDSYFATPGITYIAASGDSGTVLWPSTAPNVLSVGGTSLLLNSAGAYKSETGWIDSGGGLSQYEPEPSFQQSVQSTNNRSTPDVSLDADPNTGLSAYFVPPDSASGQGYWGVVGGTSVAAPSWAGIIAVIDQGRALAGQGSLSTSASLTTLYLAPSIAYHQVAETSSQGGIGGGGTNTAIDTPIYNTQAGLGTPNGIALIQAFVPSASSSTSTPPPATPPPPPPVSWPVPPVGLPSRPPSQPPHGPTPKPWPIPAPNPAPAPKPAPAPTPAPAAAPTPAPKQKHRRKHHVTRPGGNHHRSVGQSTGKEKIGEQSHQKPR